ncbi:alpha/beta hydrolase [Granulicella arctica]|uniref:alpha/beta hydrolase n=1 Tax=Granulicella arctica TaxID=940613 RepID=UPI0021E08E86|nr:alpha/beta hydrolase-fold protein [Granulicella arctica]
MTFRPKSAPIKPAILADRPLWSENPIRVPDDDSTIPRLESYQFHSEILPDPDHRMVLVYLPEQYAAEPDRRFPVFYLHDGQNLFDGRTSYVAGRTWEAQTTADRLTAAGEIEPVILVGIANTGVRRMAEYTPTRDFKMGGGEGRAYGRLLCDELKPFIDRSYRTKTEAHDTGLGGSSLGGLISLFLGLEKPDVFGKLAVMSPSVWWDHRSILSFVNQAHPRPALRIWLDMGTAEGARHVRDTDLLYRLLVRLGWKPGFDLAFMEAEGAVHDEAAWAQRFNSVLRFLFPGT